MVTGPLINDEPATQPLVSATAGDRCVSCGTPLSSDQRYCVACGERRGKPRFTLPAGGTAAGSLPSPEHADTAVSAPPPAPRAPRASSGTTIVAGVGTLLLAMGVGVLIGRNSADNVNARPAQAAAPTVIHVGGATGSGSGAAAAGPATSAKQSAKSGTHKGKSKTKSAAKPTAAQAAKASDAASKVLGSSNKNLPPATVTVGQTGHGPGYDKTGKFNGSFFGQ